MKPLGAVGSNLGIYFKDGCENFSAVRTRSLGSPTKYENNLNWVRLFSLAWTSILCTVAQHISEALYLHPC